MNERMQEIGKLLLKNADKVAIAVFVLLLVAAVMIWLGEQNRDAVPPDPPSPPDLTTLDKFANNEQVGKVREAFLQEGAAAAAAKANMELLIERNMFDLKSVREQTESEKRLQEQFERARELYDQGKLEESKSIAQSLIDQNPNFVRAKDLLTQINDKLNPATPAPTPEATPAQ